MRISWRHVLRIWTIAGLSCWFVVQCASAQQLTIDHLRAVTYKYGPVREGNAIRPLEELVLLYNINGAATDPDGKVSLGFAMVWTAPDGSEAANFKNDLNAVNVFGGPVTALGTLRFPESVPQGTYSLNLTVEDKLAQTSAQAKYSIVLAPLTFDIVNVRFALGSAKGPERPNRFYVYDPMYVLFDVVGFSVAEGQVDLSMDAVVQDAAGTALHTFKDMIRLNDKFPQNGQRTAGFNLLLNLTRPGQFVAVITLRDGNSGQSIVKKVPFVVEAAN